jgi:hypothetical protein
MIKVIIATHHRYIKNEIMNNHYVSLSAVYCFMVSYVGWSAEEEIVANTHSWPDTHSLIISSPS